MGLALSLGVIGFLFVIVDKDVPPVVIEEREANEALEIKDESTGVELPKGEGERAQEASEEVSPEESADAPQREPIGRALPASTRPSRHASERVQSAPGDRSSAELTFGPPELEGHFDAQDVIKVLNREHRGQLFCYESGSRGTGQRPGTLTLSLVVSPLGGVVAATIRESTLNNRNIEDCLVRGARRWNFPEPPEGGTVRINVPLVFTPASPQ
jgi:TonB family protein